MSFVNFNFATDKTAMPGILEVGSGVKGQMAGTSSITIFGFSVLIIYTITKIMNFYGFGIEVYGYYFAFYVFLLIASFILDKNYPKV
jgi:hypothetical protein